MILKLLQKEKSTTHKPPKKQRSKQHQKNNKIIDKQHTNKIQSASKTLINLNLTKSQQLIKKIYWKEITNIDHHKIENKNLLLEN